MSWWLIEVSAPSGDAESVARALVELSGQAVEERDGRVLGYAADREAALSVESSMRDRFGTRVEIKLGPVGEADWATAWREGLSVRTVGRLRLGPSWLLEPAPDAIVIDPETAFGSGEHGSTRGALALLERHLAPGGTVLDLGSGSGILTIAARKLGAETALGIEVDEEATPVAEVNAERNQVGVRVRFVTGDAAALAPLAGPATVVVSNILRNVNETLLEPIAAALAPGGLAIFAGMETPEADLFRPVLIEAGWAIVDEVIDEGWWSVAARRRA